MNKQTLSLLALAAMALPFAFACGSPDNDAVQPTTTAADSAPDPAAAPDTAPDQPYVTHRGAKPWHHWAAPAYARPNFTWTSDNNVKSVTCTAADSHGRTYAVTEVEYKGKQYQAVLPQIEDESIDRCYADSSGDQGCRYQDCSPGYR
jgi:hypothetical protein